MELTRSAPRPDRAHWVIVRCLLGVVGAVIVINTAAGLAQGRLTYSVERYVGDELVALTAPGDMALGALCSGVIGAVLLSFALAPSLYRRPIVVIVSAIAIVAAMVGLDYLG
jgi:hypothetical protein